MEIAGENMKKKRLYRQWNIKTGIMTALALAVLIFCFSMMHNINQQMNKSATSNLLNTTKVIEGNIENYIEKDFESLHVLGEMYKSGVYLDSDDLAVIYETMGFEWVGISLEQKDGAETGTGIYNTIQAADMPWYDQWKAGEQGYSDAYYGESGRIQTTLWTPIYENDELIATVFGDVLLNKYYSANVFTFYEGEGRTYLFDGEDGEWILKSLGKDGVANRQEDMYSLLLASGNKAENVENFRNAVSGKQTGTAISIFNGEESYVCFMPLATSDDWYVATVIAKDVLLKESTQVQRMIQIIFIAFCVGLFILVIAFVRWQIRQTKMKEANYREALFANISSNIDSAFLIYEKVARRTVFVSDNVKRVLGLEREWLSEDAGNLFDWCNIDQADSERQAFLDGTLDKAAVREVCIENEMGVKSRYIRVELIPADLGQEIVVLTDITKDKDIQSSLVEAMQHAEAGNKAKNEFLSAMSHDIRTPMNGIIGMTAIAAANLDDKNRVKDCLSKINDASAHLLHLINEVLDMSRIESGKMQLLEEPFNLPQTLQEVLSMNYPGIKQKSQVIEVHIHSLEHEQVIGDTLRLQRIITNLLSNAIKYTPDGGSIEVFLREKSSVIKGYGRYEIIVRDNGIGMSQEFLEKLFLPFEREEDVQIKKIQGTGLGMSIVKNIVTLMMGDIKVESEKNKGTAFQVTVNLKLDESQNISDEVLDKLPVLVVDDDDVTCETVVKMLSDIGMTGEWAQSGEAAIEKVAERHRGSDDYLAVILDWKMPEMDGVETARRIRAEIDSKVPIIILTAYDWSEIEKEGREAGVDDFMSKPIYKSKLRQKMLTLVEESDTSQELAGQSSYGQLPAGKRVLLAEDNQLNREIAVEILNMAGLEVDTAEDGAEAVTCFAESEPGTYDIILMDIQMPKMNGYEATEAIRKMDRADSRKIPIVAMTADAFVQDVQAAYVSGMNEHISKPISVEYLMQVLRRFLSDSGSGIE